MNEASDRALLRRFEPVMRFTKGERFFPMDVAPYVENCSLWVQPPNGIPAVVVPQGKLNLERLGEVYEAPFGAVHYLKFITPMNLTELAAYSVQQFQKNLLHLDEEDRFRAGRGRLARVGYASRMVDALFQLSLLARGRVPGDTAAAAMISYATMMEQQRHFRYYGRVVRQGGWVICQYWFFYAFNNWRSGFFGANDHEADWEMVCVYLSQPPDAGAGADNDPRYDANLRPVWLAYASHDFSGDDLRRHWDDPTVEKVGEHPVIYVGAGSHASYFQAGEYLAELELPFLAPLVTLQERVQDSWDRLLQRYQFRPEGEVPAAHFNFFRVPFVDYARGDGLSLGPGQAAEWDEPGLLEPPPEWVLRYRGLWGLYARDPLSGENAPAGPRYNRDGTVRRAWYDPLGWAGLDKVPSLNEALLRVLSERDRLLAEQAKLGGELEEASERLMGLGVQLAAMRDLPHLSAISLAEQQRLDALAAQVNDLRAQRAANDAKLEALQRYAQQLRDGDFGPLDAHIRRLHLPATDGREVSRFAEGWAAVSIGLFVILMVILFLFARDYLGVALGALVAALLVIEATFRRQLPRLIVTVTGLLAVLASLVLLFEYFWQVVIVLFLAVGGFLIWDNLRELWT